MYLAFCINKMRLFKFAKLQKSANLEECVNLIIAELSYFPHQKSNAYKLIVGLNQGQYESGMKRIRYLRLRWIN
jgi:hypothetical protein